MHLCNMNLSFYQLRLHYIKIHSVSVNVIIKNFIISPDQIIYKSKNKVKFLAVQV